MKKIILLITLIFVFNFAQAQNVDTSKCLDINTNLRQGNKDLSPSGQIYKLQSFLKENNHMTANATGYFGSLTFKGVISFQKKNNINPTGFVGPLTRSAIQKATCVQVTVSDPSPSPITPEVSEIPAPVIPPSVPPISNTQDVILDAPNNSSLRVRTDNIISVGTNSITVGGSVTAGARSGTEIWFEVTRNPVVYWLSETTTSTKKPQRTNDNFSDTFANLQANTTYYYRACAENVAVGQKSCGGTNSVLTGNL